MLTLALVLLALAPDVGFEWDAPSQCPSEVAVAEMVRARVGAPVREGETARLDAIARVRRTDDGRWALRLWVIDEEGTHRRDVEDESCALLAETAATMVAMFVAPSPDRVPESVEPEPAEPVEPEPASTQPVPKPAAPVAEVEVTPQPRPSTPPDTELRPLLGQLRVLAHAGVGLLPGGYGGVGLGGTLGWSGLRVDVRGRGAWTSAARVQSGGQVRLQSYGGGAAAGWAFSTGRVQVPVLAGFDVGALVGRGDGLATERSGSVGWATASLRPAVTVRWGPRVGLWASAEGFVSLLRPSVRLDDGTSVFRMPAGGGAVSLGVVFFFAADTESRGQRQPRREGR
ncbi:MAG: hypothetical protein AAGA54_04585 [Myxococcota bacterium]